MFHVLNIHDFLKSGADGICRHMEFTFSSNHKKKSNNFNSKLFARSFSNVPKNTDLWGESTDRIPRSFSDKSTSNEGGSSNSSLDQITKRFEKYLSEQDDIIQTGNPVEQPDEQLISILLDVRELHSRNSDDAEIVRLLAGLSLWR